MSIKNLLTSGAELQGWSTIYAKSVITPSLSVEGDTPAIMENLDVSGTLNVTGDTNINGNNYSTPDLGAPNYSLHTDGAGSTFWAADAIGSGDVSYSGVGPTVAGQLSRFSGVDGLEIEQTAISDDGANLDLNNQNITNVNLVDGVDVSAFKADYDNKVNQDVKQNANPKFTDVEANQYLIYDPVTMGVTYDLRSDSGQMQIYNSTGNVQMRVQSNDYVEVVNKLDVNQLATLKGNVELNTGALSLKFPTNRGFTNAVLTTNTATGQIQWDECRGYCLSFGGVMSSLPKLAIANGDPDNNTNDVLDAKTQVVIPKTANLRIISYNTDTASATTSMLILKNGVQVATYILGQFGIKAADVTFNDGDRLAVRFTGTPASNTNIQCYFS